MKKLLAMLVSIIAAIAANGQDSSYNKPEDSMAADDDHNRNELKGISCMEAGGECMSKKNCDGKIYRKNRCTNRGEVCCNSEINQCVAEVGLLKETIKEGSDSITSDIEIKMNMLANQLNYIKANLYNSGCGTQASTPDTTPAPTCTTADWQEGFCRMNYSNKSYKIFIDTPRNWTMASAKCADENLIIAHPTDPIGLRRYIVSIMEWRTKYAWLNAKGDGTQFKWQDNNELITKNSTFWSNYPGSGQTSSDCLLMLSSTSHLTSNPLQPYYAHGCGNKYYALCEDPVVH